MLTNREVASLILIGLFVVLTMLIRSVREMVPVIVKQLFVPRLLVLWLIYFAYSAGLVTVAATFGVWTPALLKDTVIVVVLVGLPLLVGAISATDGLILVRRVILESLGIGALLLFYVNLVSMPLVAELLAQALVIVVSAFAAFAETQGRKARPIAKFFNACLILVGLGLLVFTTINLISNWATNDVAAIVQSLALSIWFPLALIPLVYALSFYSQIEQLLVHLPTFNDRQKHPLRVRFAIIIGFHGSTRLASSFVGRWRFRTANLSRWRATRALMKEYRNQMKVRRRLEKDLAGLLLAEYQPDQQELNEATSEEPFIHTAFEFLREVATISATVVSLRRGEADAGLGRNQAIAAGQLTRVLKLIRSLVRQLSDKHDGDLQMSITREVLESLATVRYLLQDDDSRLRYDAFVNDSLIAEREFKRDVDAQVASRGVVLPIEERILGSIAESFDAAGVAEGDLPSRRVNHWPSAKERIDLLGPVAYSAYRMGSNAVHGSFTDLEKNHLHRTSDRFDTVLDAAPFRPQPLFAIALLTVETLQEYLEAWIPEAAPVYEDRTSSLEQRIRLADASHEAYLQRIRQP